MTMAEINKIRGRSRAKSDGPWVTDFDEMAKKTVVRRLTKYLPSSPKMDRAIEAHDRGEIEVTATPVTPGRMDLRRQSSSLPGGAGDSASAGPQPGGSVGSAPPPSSSSPADRAANDSNVGGPTGGKAPMSTTAPNESGGPPTQTAGDSVQSGKPSTDAAAASNHAAQSTSGGTSGGATGSAPPDPAAIEEKAILFSEGEETTIRKTLQAARVGQPRPEKIWINRAMEKHNVAFLVDVDEKTLRNIARDYMINRLKETGL
jgi:hypothetical protein